MSIGFFLGFTNSYSPECAAEAASFVDKINSALNAHGHAPYVDVTPELPALGMGRCSLDHFIAGGLSRFSAFAREHNHHVAFEASGVRDVFLPIQLDAPLSIPVGKFLWFTRHAKVGSLTLMSKALLELAPMLDIPIVNNAVDDSVASLINEMRPLHADDHADAVMLEDLRIAWLLYHEAANLAIKHNAALTLGA